MKTMTIEALVVGLKKEFNTDVFEHIVNRYVPLYKNCFNQIKVPNYDLEDYYQEGQIIMLEAIDMYDPAKQHRFSGFFKLLYKNRIINLCRADQAYKRGGGVRELSLEYQSNKSQSEINLLDQIENHYHISAQDMIELKEVHNLFIDSLSSLERKVFFNYQKGDSVREIAKQLVISETQVQSAYDRCRKKLKDSFSLE
ncbi:MAG TPA: sigma-70 family RNA polymerase sigma factor [Facklamia tabacinasalis]|nr:sigma-70 family RNA polymerase sigma factor [Ruoffia tabacinasalis]